MAKKTIWHGARMVKLIDEEMRKRVLKAVLLLERDVKMSIKNTKTRAAGSSKVAAGVRKEASSLFSK